MITAYVTLRHLLIIGRIKSTHPGYRLLLSLYIIARHIMRYFLKRIFQKLSINFGRELMKRTTQLEEKFIVDFLLKKSTISLENRYFNVRYNLINEKYSFMRF